MFLKLMNERTFAPDDGTGSAASDAGNPAGGEGEGGAAAASGAEDKTLLSGGEADKAADPEKVKDAAAARKAELEAMTPEDRAKAEKEDADKAQAEADAARLKEVPEDGKYEFTMPDGIELDTEFAERAGPALKEAGVTREQANKLAQFMAEDRKAQAENWARTQEDWVKNARTDKEYGGDKFDASIKGARRVLDKYGTPELSEYLTASGGGNHPEIIRLLARVGNDISDDKPVGSGGGGAARDSLATLYPNDLKGK